MRKIVWATLICGFCLLPILLSAQGATIIKGKVTDDAGNILIGANVFIESTGYGGATGMDGQYTFLVPVGQTERDVTVTARFMGYKPKSADLQLSAGTLERDFSLEPDILKMEEIVVTGTGYELKKKELASPVTTINRREIEMAPAETIDELLQSRMSGGSVNMNTGQPGAGSRLRIRGVNSATVSQTPVIYVDGVRVDAADNARLEIGSGGPVSSALSDILVSDIDRVEVIKGGAAATLYGSEAANGVIQIFTKKGKAGEPRWKFSLQQGVNMPETKYLYESMTEEFFLQNGHYQKYSGSLDGGTALLTYHLSANLQKQQGVMLNNNDIKLGLNAGFRAFPMEKLQLDFNAGLVRHNFERNLSNNHIGDMFGAMEAHDPAFFMDGVTDADRQEIVDAFFMIDNDEYVNRYTFGTTARYNPAPYFTAKLTLGTDYRKNEQRYFTPIAAGWISVFPNGALERHDREYLSLTLDWANTLKFPYEGDIQSTLTFGAQGFREEDRQLYIIGEDFALEGVEDFDNAASLSPTESNWSIFSGGLYLNEQLGYKDRIFLNAGIRVDGNTAFGDRVTSVAYPKLGLAYNISDESFWPGGKWVSSFKLRTSYGKTGMFPDPFTRDRTYIQGPYLSAVSVQFNNPGDPNLKPEKTTTIEGGMDAAFLNDRIAVELTYFQDKTTDALFDVPEDPSTGWDEQLRNLGVIENKGIEVAVNANVLNKKDYKLDIGGSFATLDNKVTDMGGAAGFNIGGFDFLPLRIEEGHPVGVFRTNRPLGNGQVAYDELVYSPIADKSFGLNLYFTYKNNLRLGLAGDGQMGGYILNTGSVLRFFNLYYVFGEEFRVPEGYDFVTASEVFIEKSDYFKLREVSLTYTLPWTFGGRIHLSAKGRNLLILSRTREMDPEMNGVRSARDVDVGGINFFTLSPPRQVVFGVTYEL